MFQQWRSAFIKGNSGPWLNHLHTPKVMFSHRVLDSLHVIIELQGQDCPCSKQPTASRDTNGSGGIQHFFFLHIPFLRPGCNISPDFCFFYWSELLPVQMLNTHVYVLYKKGIWFSSPEFTDKVRIGRVNKRAPQSKIVSSCCHCFFLKSPNTTHAITLKKYFF